MNDQETKIANKMFEHALRYEETPDEIRWCIDQVDAGRKTFLEAVEWCGLEYAYYRAKKEVEGAENEMSCESCNSTAIKDTENE